MTLLNELQNNLIDTHLIAIKPTSSYFKEQNKKVKDIKSVYKIKIYHPDKPAGFFFSKYANHYYKIIQEILDKHSNGRLYITCTTECSNDLEFDITWNRNRKLK